MVGKRSRSRRALIGRVLALSALAPALFPSTARADGVVGGALYLSFSFGEKYGLGWGAEAFSTAIISGTTDGCSSERRAGIGPTIQIGTVGLTPPRIVVAVQGGGEIDENRMFAASGELGGVYRFGDNPGFGFHTGLISSGFFAHMFVRGDIGLDEYAIGGGPRITNLAGPYGELGTCVIGRPLRGERGPRVAPSPIFTGEGSPRPGARDDLARAFADDAAEECASIPAFLQLATELLALGAPDALVERALVAAEEEVSHALMCSTLASHYAGHAVRARYPDDALRPVWLGERGATRLAVESWIDGCLGEAAAATRAKRAAAKSKHDAPRALQRKIARDEASHAELGFDVVAWLARHPRFGTKVRDALGATRRELPFRPASPRDLPRDAAAHGLLAASEHDAILEAEHARSALRVEALLQEARA